MRKGLSIVVLLAASSFAGQAHAADKVRFGYIPQIHQANMIVVHDYARTYDVDVDVTPMRRYADLQLALMTGQIDAAAMGYINIGLMQERNYSDYRAVAGVFRGGQSLMLAKGVHAGTWKDLQGLRLGTGPNSYAELLFKTTATLAGADISKITTVSFAAGGPPAIAALKNRDIDGFVFWEPTPADASVQGIGDYSLLDIGDNPTAHINGLIIVHSGFLKAHRSAVLGLVKADIDATNALNADPARFEEVAATATGSPPAVVKTAIPHGTLDYRLYAREAKTLLKMIREAGMTRTDTSPAIDTQYDYSLLMEATGKSMKDLGGE